MYNHTSNDNGDMNENRFCGFSSGFAYKILIPEKCSKDLSTLILLRTKIDAKLPSVMNGLEKSTADRLIYVIVRSQIAKSAF